jgi:xylan 1,4-beta-xylosidase
MKEDKDDMHNFLLNIKQTMNNEGVNLPLYITAYNYSINRKHPLLDTLFMADYVIKNYIDNMELIDSFSYWNFQNNDNIVIDTSFSGGSGLYFKHDIPKPQRSAYTFLRFLKDEILQRGDGYIITRNSDKKDTLYILLYNYEHPQFNENKIELSSDIYNVFPKNERKKIHINISNIHSNNSLLRIFSLNRMHGSAYDKWVSMGRPLNNQYHTYSDIVYSILRASSISDYKELSKKVLNDTLTLDFTLDPLEVKGIKIKLK